ncbi:hypothetical protein RIF29_45485 [Crotalaria pallida]|uniref:Uncharacterized protein n=1 Tax=Crotalaria pallida TaxID=3830 RepID=A0AAN9DR73_CROPI
MQAVSRLLAGGPSWAHVLHLRKLPRSKFLSRSEFSSPFLIETKTKARSMVTSFFRLTSFESSFRPYAYHLKGAIAFYRVNGYPGCSLIAFHKSYSSAYPWITPQSGGDETGSTADGVERAGLSYDDRSRRIPGSIHNKVLGIVPACGVAIELSFNCKANKAPTGWNDKAKEVPDLTEKEKKGRVVQSPEDHSLQSRECSQFTKPMKQVWSSSVQLASLPISYVRSTPPSVKEAGHEMSLSSACESEHST